VGGIDLSFFSGGDYPHPTCRLVVSVSASSLKTCLVYLHVPPAEDLAKRSTLQRMTMTPNSGLGHRSGGKRPAISESMYWRMGDVVGAIGRSIYCMSEDAPGV
jgi:hypothetical protein